METLVVIEGSNKKTLFDDAYETVESIGMQREGLPGVTARCNILAQVFTLPFLHSAALLTLQQCVLMYLCTSCSCSPSPTSNMVFLVTLLFLQNTWSSRGNVRRKHRCSNFTFTFLFLYTHFDVHTGLQGLYSPLHRRTRRITSQHQDYWIGVCGKDRGNEKTHKCTTDHRAAEETFFHHTVRSTESALK